MRKTSSRISFWVLTVFSKFWTRFKNSWDDPNDSIDTRLKKDLFVCVLVYASLTSIKQNVLSVYVHIFHQNSFKKQLKDMKIKCWVRDAIFLIAVFRKLCLVSYLRGVKWNFMLFLIRKIIIILRICEAALITYYKRNFISDVSYWSFTN